MPPTGGPRTTFEARLDASYGVRLHELHARLFRRLRWIISGISLLSATAVFAPVFGGDAFVGKVGAALVVLFTIIDAISGLPERIAAHELQRGRFLDLLGKTSDASPLGDIDSVYHQIERAYATEFDSLAEVAFNDNLRRHGLEKYMRPESVWAKAFRFLA